MRSRLAIFVLCVASVFTSAVPLLAHHAFAATFDNKKPISLTGKVTKIDWLNPHVYVYIDVKDVKDESKVVNYAVECGSGPNGLVRQGWRRDTLKIGDGVSIEGFLAKDGSNTVNAISWILPNGKKIFSDGGPSERP